MDYEYPWIKSAVFHLWNTGFKGEIPERQSPLRTGNRDSMNQAGKSKIQLSIDYLTITTQFS